MIALENILVVFGPLHRHPFRFAEISGTAMRR